MLSKYFIRGVLLFFIPLAQHARANTTSPVEITADKMTLIDKENKAIAEGNVISKQEDKTLLSDRLIAFFEKDKEVSQKVDNTQPSGFSSLKKIVAITTQKNKPVLFITSQIHLKCYDSLTYEIKAQKVTAIKQARLKNLKQNYTLLAPKIVAYFFDTSNKSNQKQSIKKFEGFGGITLIRGSQIAKGKTAVYHSNKETIELFDNVTLVDNNQKLTGNYGHMDLNKGITKVFSNKPNTKNTTNKKQVRMLLMPNQKVYN